METLFSQVAVLGGLLLWFAGFVFLHIDAARDSQERLKRCLPPCVCAALPALLLAIANRIAVSYSALELLGHELPMPMNYSWREAPWALPLTALFPLSVAVFFFLPVLGLTFLPKEPRSRWKAAGLGALWGVACVPPLPWSKAGWVCLCFPIVLAGSSALLVQLRSLAGLAGRLSPRAFWSAAVGGCVPFIFLYALNLHLRLPRPGWTTPALVRALDDGPSPEMASAVLRKLPPHARAEAVPLGLITRTHSQDPYTSSWAFYMLRSYGYYQDRSDAELIRLLREDPQWRIREHAAQILHRSTHAAVLPALARAFAEDPDESVRSMALWAISKNPSPASDAFLLKASTHPREWVRQAAIAELAHRRPSRDPRKLLAQAADFRERDKALDELGKLDARKTVPALIRALEDAGFAHRPQAAWALGRFCTPAAETALVKALDSEFSSIRHAAAEAVAEDCRSARAVAGLRRMLQKPGDAKVALASLYFNDGLGEAEWAWLKSLFGGTDRLGLRRGAARLMKRHPKPEAAPILVAALGDPDDQVRRRAVFALSRLDPPCGEAVPVYARALESEGWRGLRVRAAGFLGACADARALPALRRARKDKDRFVRDAAERALKRLDRASPP